MSTHIERVTATTVAPVLMHADDLADDQTPLAEDHVGLAVGDVVLIEGTHDELRTLLLGGLALVDHDARALDTAAAEAAADTDAAEAAANRMTWTPGDVVITPPPAGSAS